MARTAAEVVESVRAADAAGEPLLLLGGGSNVVIADEGVPGVALLVRSTGHTVEPLPDGAVLVTVEAGEDWDALVAATVGMGLGGLECLSGIPGSTGATPVQNVGAYGVEVADVLVDVDLYDRRAGEVRPHVPAAELGLGYRASVLKHRDDAVVLRVRFRLRPDGTSAPIRYPELARALGVTPDATVAAGAARMAVLDLRRGKGMVLDPADHDTWSVGSFFTNPVLPVADVPDEPDLAALARRAGPGEAAGGVAHRTQLVSVAAGPARAAGSACPPNTCSRSATGVVAPRSDLLALAGEVRDGVRTRFGVDLVPEPVLVGCSL